MGEKIPEPIDENVNPEKGPDDFASPAWDDSKYSELLNTQAGEILPKEAGEGESMEEPRTFEENMEALEALDKGTEERELLESAPKGLFRSMGESLKNAMGGVMKRGKVYAGPAVLATAFLSGCSVSVEDEQARTKNEDKK